MNPTRRHYSILCLMRGWRETRSLWTIHKWWHGLASTVVILLTAIYMGNHHMLSTVPQIALVAGAGLAVSFTGSFIINVIRAPKLLYEELLAEKEKLEAENDSIRNKPKECLTLMSVDFEHNPHAVGHPITIRPVFRNDYSVSKHVRAIRWELTRGSFPASEDKRQRAIAEHHKALEKLGLDPWDVDEETEATLPAVPEPVNSKILPEGFQTKPVDDWWSPRTGGYATVVVHPNGVFRAGIEIRNADLDDLKKRSAEQLLGTLTLSIDGEEVAFNL